MNYETFFSDKSKLPLTQNKQGTVIWRCPSNIDLVKYWGNYDEQLPCNPSISLTLTNAFTETKIDYLICDEPSLDFSLDGKNEPVYMQLITEFIDKLDNYFSFLEQLKLDIHSFNSNAFVSTANTFASLMGSLALCLCTIEEEIGGHKSSPDVFFRKAAFVARLGSGSATRSVYGGGVVWGKLSELQGSSDLYGVRLENNPLLNTLQDAILIVSTENLPDSGSIGHSMMHNHTLAANRFEQATSNILELIEIIKENDNSAFCKLIEDEALTMHAMIMNSSPSSLVLYPRTVNIISKVRAFREESGIPICFTLDAGPNVHLLYPEEYRKSVKHFIERELLAYCENGKWFDDHVGSGPTSII